MRRRTLAVSAAGAAALAMGLGTAVARADARRDRPRQAAGFDFAAGEVVAGGLTIPWGLTFLPDGTALSAQRDTGEVLRLAPGTEPEAVGTLPSVPNSGQFDERGLLGLACSPAYADDGLVYAYYSTEQDNRVVRFSLDQLEPEPIVTGIPVALIHNGGRLAFGPDGLLYITTGDADETANAQDLDSLAGKILRVEPDGAVPEDNPYAGSPVYTWGNRNVQGLAWDGGGELYFSELGQNTWDELNHAQAGANYGWPIVEGVGDDPDYVDPLVTWSPAEASPSGAAVVGGLMYVAALRGQRLWTVPVADGEAGTPTAVLEGQIGRIRTVEPGPDGWLWVATSNGGGQDEVLRYPPLEE